MPADYRGIADAREEGTIMFARMDTPWMSGHMDAPPQARHADHPTHRRARARRQPVRTALATLLVVTLACLAPNLAGGHLGVARAAGGFSYTSPALQETAGRDTGTFTLATTTFDASINVAGAPNPSVNWGDGTVDSLSFDPNPFDTAMSPCHFANDDPVEVNCSIQDHHTYQVSGAYSVTVNLLHWSRHLLQHQLHHHCLGRWHRRRHRYRHGDRHRERLRRERRTHLCPAG
jgi:hypothetical protein